MGLAGSGLQLWQEAGGQFRLAGAEAGGTEGVKGQEVGQGEAPVGLSLDCGSAIAAGAEEDGDKE